MSDKTLAVYEKLYKLLKIIKDHEDIQASSKWEEIKTSDLNLDDDHADESSSPCLKPSGMSSAKKDELIIPKFKDLAHEPVLPLDLKDTAENTDWMFHQSRCQKTSIAKVRLI